MYNDYDMRIASWNILSDRDVPKHDSQAIRLDKIAETIRKSMQVSGSYLIYLCEFASSENAHYVANKTGLATIGEPIEYNDEGEHGIFLADAGTAQRTTPSEIIVDETHSMNMVEVDGLKIIGVHMPWHFINKRSQRKLHTDKIIEARPDILLGDLNSPTFFKMRKRLEASGLTEAHSQDRPVFPHPSFRGVNTPLLWPNMNIDVVYYGAKVDVKAAGHSLGKKEASDHPIIWVDIEHTPASDKITS